MQEVGLRPPTRFNGQTPTVEHVAAKTDSVLAAPFGAVDADALKQMFRSDLKSISTLHSSGISALGAATIPASRQHDVYLSSVRFGTTLGERGIGVRTGGGPGIMAGAPAGNLPALRSRMRSVLFALSDGAVDGSEAELEPIESAVRRYLGETTQGVSLNLPNEPRNADIEEDNDDRMRHFPFRKEGLLDRRLGIRGAAMFPGGLGTLEEDFQVWAASQHTETEVPLVAVRKDFHDPWLSTLRRVAVDERALIDRATFERLHVVDDGAEAARDLANRVLDNTRPAEMVSFRAELIDQMERAVDFVAETPWSVTLLGAGALDPQDPAVRAVGQAAATLAGAGVPLKASRQSRWLDAVASAARTARPDATISAALHAADPHASALSTQCSMSTTFETVSAHHEAVIDKSSAYVVMPGDLETLMRTFTILDWFKVGQLPPRPVVLVGSDYWRPLMASVEKAFQDGMSKSFPKRALAQCHFVDDADAIVRILDTHASHR